MGEEQKLSNSYQFMTTPPVQVMAGDQITWGADLKTAKLWVRNLTAERRAKVDQAVRMAAERRYAQWGADAVSFTLRTMAETNQVYLGMAAEVAKAWRDVNTPPWERA